MPLDPLRLGSLSTRTTHPFYMARFNELLSLLGMKVTLSNPYGFRTKGEMVSGCLDPDFIASEARNTMSCSSPAKARWQGATPMHCGFCVPCLIRRASLVAGLGADDTDYHLADLKTANLNSAKAEGMHVRSFQHALDRLKKNPSRAASDIHLPGPLVDHPKDLVRFENVYRDGMREVEVLLAGVRAAPR